MTAFPIFMILFKQTRFALTASLIYRTQQLKQEKSFMWEELFLFARTLSWSSAVFREAANKENTGLPSLLRLQEMSPCPSSRACPANELTKYGSNAKLHHRPGVIISYFHYHTYNLWKIFVGISGAGLNTDMQVIKKSCGNVFLCCLRKLSVIFIAKMLTKSSSEPFSCTFKSMAEKEKW